MIDKQFISEFEEVYYRLGHHPRAVIVDLKQSKAEYQRMNIDRQHRGNHKA